MKGLALSRVLLGFLLAPMAWVELHGSEPVRLIPKVYVSPGASGSIGSFERYQHSESSAAQAFLPYRDSAPSRLREHKQTERVRGALQQSLEYPAGVGLQQPRGTGQRP